MASPIFEPVPSYAQVVLLDESAKDSADKVRRAKFNPIWLKWFLDLAALTSNSSNSLTGGTAVQVLHGNGPTWGAVKVSTDVAGLGTGIASALAVNIGSTGAPVIFNGALGTPSGGVATNLTGTAAGLTVGYVTTNANLTGPITSAGNATSVASQTGTGSTFVMNTSPAITTSLTTPSASFALVNTTATTVNAFGAATTLNIGSAGTQLTETALVLGAGITSISGGTNPSLNIGAGALTAGAGAFSSLSTSGATGTIQATGVGGIADIAIGARYNSTNPYAGILIDNSGGNAYFAFNAYAVAASATAKYSATAAGAFRLYSAGANNAVISVSTATGTAGGNITWSDVAAFSSTGLAVTGAISTSGYTVAGLPSGTIGQRAYVTDAVAPTFLGVLVGGGTVTTPVFYNGVAWVSG